MARALLLLIAFATLSAWTGAQAPPAPLTAAEQVKLFKLNRPLLDNLVNHGIDIADKSDPLERAKECRKTCVPQGGRFNPLRWSRCAITCRTAVGCNGPRGAFVRRNNSRKALLGRDWRR